MTKEEVTTLAWDIGGSIVGVLTLVAVILIGLAVVKEITR